MELSDEYHDHNFRVGPKGIEVESASGPEWKYYGLSCNVLERGASYPKGVVYGTRALSQGSRMGR